MTWREFDRVRALVTGGASGIGLATAQRLAREGAQVAVLDLARRRPGRRSTRAGRCHRRRRGARGSRRSGGPLGGLDILVNNAGIGAQGRVEDNDDDEWHRVLDVNVLGLVRVTRAALPICAARRTPRSSTPARSPPPPACRNRALYSASKGAVLALTRAMAADLIADGIRVNAVNPGTADTPWVGRLLDARRRPRGRAGRARGPPAARPAGSADEVADAIAYLASPGRLDHGDVACRRRRDGRPAPAAEEVTCGESQRSSGCGPSARPSTALRTNTCGRASSRRSCAGARHQLLHLPARRAAVQAIKSTPATDYDADMARVAADDTTRRWSRLHRPLPAAGSDRGRGRVVDAGRRAVPPRLMSTPWRVDFITISGTSGSAISRGRPVCRCCVVRSASTNCVRSSPLTASTARLWCRRSTVADRDARICSTLAAP